MKLVTITICTARPGIVIGKGGQDVDKLKEELKNLFKKEIQINIFEVKKPELDANIVGNNIARQVEGKIAYVVLSRWQLLTLCALVLKVSKFKLQVV